MVVLSDRVHYLVQTSSCTWQVTAPPATNVRDQEEMSLRLLPAVDETAATVWAEAWLDTINATERRAGTAAISSRDVEAVRVDQLPQGCWLLVLEDPLDTRHRYLITPDWRPHLLAGFDSDESALEEARRLAEEH